MQDTIVQYYIVLYSMGGSDGSRANCLTLAHRLLHVCVCVRALACVQAAIQLVPTALAHCQQQLLAAYSSCTATPRVLPAV